MNKLIKFLSFFILNPKRRKEFRAKYQYINNFDFIKSKLLDSNYSDDVLDLYTEIKNIDSHIIPNFVLNRILKYSFLKTIKIVENKYPEKEILILTDSKYNFENYKKINITDIEKIQNCNNYVFIVGYNKDFEGLEAIKKLTSLNINYYSVKQAFPITRYFLTDKTAYCALLDEYNKKDRLGSFSPIDFENIFQALNITRYLKGDYVEIGTYKGASARAALNYMEKANINRKSYFLDTYEGFNYNEAKKSLDAIWLDTHTETSIDEVNKYIKNNNYTNYKLIKTNICSDELPSEINEIAVANIDVDMYDAIKAALYKVKDKIVQHGIILVEDFGHTPNLIGAQKAVYEFLEENPNKFIPIYGSGSQMYLIKIG